ncbi:MAG TPA: cytidine deaminase [Vicinamibacteria bacterium]|nr:cytidine deaminase [Vicinamibacteria bacterium]
MKRAAKSRSRPRGLRGLAELAAEARQRAAAPFSRFKVGAALRTRTGEVVTGCNVESAAYGLTMCAERVAVFKAVSEGLREFDAVAVVADSPRLTAPCGACRQVLWEYCGDVWVHVVDLRGGSRTLRMSELLPLPFDARNL